MRNLAPDNTPELTGERRASLCSAVTVFVVHYPTPEPEAEERSEMVGKGAAMGQGAFVTRPAHGDVTGRELATWADTITAALRAFSGTGGSPAPSRSSSRSPTPTPTQSSHPGTSSRRTPSRTSVANKPPSRHSSSAPRR